MNKYLNAINNIPNMMVKNQCQPKAILQKGSAMVEASFGMFTIVVMLLASIWFFQIMNFAVEEEIQAGIELRQKVLDANDQCLTDIGGPQEVDKKPSIKSSFNITKFIGAGNDEFETHIQRISFGGPCQGLTRTGFHLSEDRYFKRLRALIN